MKPIRKVFLLANLDKPGVGELVPQLEQYFDERKIFVEDFLYRGNPEVPQVRPADLAVVLGGDGTMLFAARALHGQSLPVLGVNLGTLGFITETVREEWRDAFEKYQHGQLGLSPRLMIRVSVWRQGAEAAHFIGLNEAVVSASGSSKIVYLQPSLSGVGLGEYKADGLMVATPTGSTAYSLAAGGPILHPETEALILTPICPHSLSHRPIVLPGDEIVNIFVPDKQRTDVVLTVDGRDIFSLTQGDAVRIERIQQKLLLVRSDRRSFYEVVRAKLN